MSAQTQPAPSTLKAAAWMAGWLSCMLAMAIAGRETASRLNAFQVMELRSILGFLMLLPLVFIAGGFSAMKTRIPIQHIVRNGVHYAAQWAWLVAVTLIPLAQVVSIEFTMPIWVALLAVVFLGERMNAWKVSAIVLGLIGVWIIVRPEAGQINHGQLISLFAAFGFAVSVIMTKTMTRSDSVTKIIFWMLIVQGLIGLVPSLFVWQSVPTNLWPWVFLVAFVGTFSHFCLAQAIRYADATVVVPMDFLRVPLTAIAAWLVYSEKMDLYTVLGAALILVGNLLNLKRAAPK